MVALLLLLALAVGGGLSGPGPEIGPAAPVPPLPLPPPGVDVDPDFSEPIKNVTVAVGREAVLNCLVNDLGPYKVGWLRAEDQTVLALHDKVVTHNSRVSVSHDNQKTWQLHIRQVKETDRGCYMCQINTSIMKKQLGCVDVLVPPDIVDDETSSDVTVREGEDATLVCRATGRPMPRVVWRREDGESLILRNGPRDVTRVDTFSGEELRLTKLDRRQMAAYLCIASNDVPPAKSKRITLNINFAPIIKVPNQLVGAPLGTDVQLECFVEAFPNTINYWIKNRGEMLLNGSTHLVEEERNSYKVHLRLTVRHLSPRDLGTYTCVSTNSLGHADGTVRLYEIKVPTRVPTTTTEKQEITTTTIRTTVPKLVGEKSNPLVMTTSAPQHAMIAVSHTPQPPPPPPPPPRNLPAEAEVSSGARRGGTSPSNRSSPIAVLGLVIILLLKTQRCR